MKYLCLCYYNPDIANVLSADETRELTTACKPHYEEWEKSKKIVALGALSDPQPWKTIRPADTLGNTDSPPTVADGPYLPHGHRIGGFFIVEARDIDEAIEIAAKHPSAHTGRFLGGGIEVCACEAFELL